MTHEKAKDQVAKDHGFECWEHVLSKRNYRIEEVSGLIDEAAELYAKSKWDEACESYKRKLMNYLPYRDIILDTPESRGETNITGLEAPQASPDKPKTEEPMNQLEKEQNPDAFDILEKHVGSNAANGYRDMKTVDVLAAMEEYAIKWTQKALRDGSEMLAPPAQEAYVNDWLIGNGLKTPEVSNTSEPISEGLRVDFDINNPDRVTPGN